MKRKILIITLLVLEIIMFFFFALGSIFTSLQATPVINIIYIIGKWFYGISKGMMKGIHLDKLFTAMYKGNYLNLNIVSSIVVFNIFFIIIYYLVFDILTLIIYKRRQKKIRSLVAPYELSSSEYDKFDYRHYLSRFPIKRSISLIIPILFIFTFFSIRFDKTLCNELESKLAGNLDISKSFLEPFYSALLSPINAHNLFKDIFGGYVKGVSKAFNGFNWIEYIILVLSSILLIVVWYGLFTILHLVLRKPFAKLKANTARRNYVYKMEYIEYKLRIKYKDETSIKSDDFMHIIEAEQKEAAKEIARFKSAPEEVNETRDSELKKKAYYEEIGQGVTDLGVSEEGAIDLDTPIIERQVKYISDEEIDIILDEEPVIEIVESDVEENNIDFGRDRIFFERYQPDDIEIKTIEEYAGVSFKEEAIKNTDCIEEPIVENNEENKVDSSLDSIETSKEEVIVEMVKEEKNALENNEEESITEKPLQEEHVEQEIESVEKEKETHTEEVPNEVKDESNDSLENIGEKSQEEPIASEEVNESKGKVIEEKPKEKVDPFAKWRGRRNAPGYGAKKVPSFKELKEQLKDID